MLARAKDNLQSLPIETRYRVRFVTANLTDPHLLEGESFDFAACLFSTLGMVRGVENRAKVVANAFRLLRPGGRFVVHAHNRYFRRLGWRRVLGQRLKTLLGRAGAGDITMPQAYGGAALTLHHFTQGELVRLLENAGFIVTEMVAIDEKGTPATGSRVYGWLLLALRK
jgi:SAM-dependent methyltransferase